MSERRADAGPEDHGMAELVGLAEEVVPALVARLRASRLGELEVRSEGWRIRLRRDASATRRGLRSMAGDVTPTAALEDAANGVARSPAVGYFNPGALLVVGRTVAAGDALGSVDMLGIAQEVSAPSGGIVSAVLAEAGQAVEYGQALAEIDALDDEYADVAQAEDGSTMTAGVTLAPGADATPSAAGA